MATVAALALLLLYLGQDKLLLFPMPEDPNRGNLAVAGAVPWHEHGAYRGLVFEPIGTAKGKVLFLHGNAGAAQFRSIYARPITAQSFRLVLHEYPGYGARPGKATLRAALASAQEDAALARTRSIGCGLFQLPNLSGTRSRLLFSGRVMPWAKIRALWRSRVSVQPTVLVQISEKIK